MEQFGGIGKVLLIVGALIMLAGLLIIIFGKVPFIGKLPGDFSFKGKNWSVHIPIATSILLSLLLTLILYIVRRFF